jgi:hypothetical protein
VCRRRSSTLRGERHEASVGADVGALPSSRSKPLSRVPFHAEWGPTLYALDPVRLAIATRKTIRTRPLLSPGTRLSATDANATNMKRASALLVARSLFVVPLAGRQLLWR